MLHGKIDLAYAQHRHCLWCERLVPRNHGSHQPRPASEEQSPGANPVQIGAG